MWYEADIDAKMERTAGRPIPSGRIDAQSALHFGVALAVSSVLVMGLTVNVVAALLLTVTILLYVVVYTIWLKRRTAQNIVIGGLSGALPPLLGWAAVTGQMSAEAWLLVLLIFVWTPPHFWALAIHRRDEYANAGIPMLPVTHGIELTKSLVWYYTILLLLVSLLPYFIGMMGPLYLMMAVVFGLGFMREAWRLRYHDKEGQAMRTFGFSIVYLLGVFGGLLLDRLINIALS